jgi:rSAM/selenodomain-associated transferase 2
VGIQTEIIVVDGGSKDGTIHEAENENIILIQCQQKGRAAQMNEGAKKARGTLLYFLHADSLPPKTLYQDIMGAINQGYQMGCYRLRFDLNHWFLRFNAWFTRFDVNAFRFGDQSLFCLNEIFQKAGGFCEQHTVMEDQEIVKRLRRHGKFIILSKEITTSARKYTTNGIYKMQVIFILIYLMYKFGYSQQNLVSILKTLIKQDKL